jgi:dihydroxyacetone kinase
MKKLVNDPNRFVPEMLEGLLKAHPGHIAAVEANPQALVRVDAPLLGKVGLATGGGSGHLPVFLGYVGKGMLDGCAVGDVFAAPSADCMYEVTKRINGGKGVLYVYGNYNGDRMNFEMAAEMAAADDIPVRHIRVHDDVFSAPREEAGRRRGVAGMVLAFKVAGASADRGASLDHVEAVTRKAIDNMRTMGVGLSPCTVPAAGRPTFQIADGEMEMGIGIHGEPGMKRESLKRADEVAERLTTTILEDLNAASALKEGDRMAVMVNGLGATPPEELYILYRKVHDVLTKRRLRIVRAYVGEYATSMEMAGASVSLFKLDDELVELLAQPAHTPFFTQV